MFVIYHFIGTNVALFAQDSNLGGKKQKQQTYSLIVFLGN